MARPAASTGCTSSNTGDLAKSAGRTTTAPLRKVARKLISVQPRVLLLVSSASPLGGRVAEAIRIAAGLQGTARFREVAIFLSTTAVRALVDDAAVGDEVLGRYLPALSARGACYLEAGAAALLPDDNRVGAEHEFSDSAWPLWAADFDHIIPFG